MVVGALMQLAVAAPIGALFGAAYGTSIRIGYEIIFPALFGNKATSQSVDQVLTKMTQTFTGIGGLEAQAFGVNQGIKNALKAIDADPELQALIKKNSNLDTLNITVKQSGSLETGQSSVQSQSSVSDQDFTGGLAERHRKLRAALPEAKASERRELTQQYTDVFRAYEEQFGLVPFDILQQIVNVSGGRWQFVHWNFNFMSFSLQQELLSRLRNAATDTSGSGTTFTGGLEPQIPVTNLTGKKAAGQSQRLEKTKLINEIRKLKADLAAILARPLIRGFSQITKVRFADTTRRQLSIKQQLLVNLLARYRF